MRVALLSIISLMFSSSLWANMPKAFKVEIRHPRTALLYEWDGKTLKATDRAMQTSFELKKCNERLLADFFAVEETHFRNRPAQTPDSVRVKRNTESFLVSTRSALGQYLVTLKDQLLLLKAQESTLCK